MLWAVFDSRIYDAHDLNLTKIFEPSLVQANAPSHEGVRGLEIILTFTPELYSLCSK